MQKLANLRQLAVLAAAACVLLAAPTAALAVPIATQTIAGPAASIDGLGGIAVARDGGAAVVYLAQVAGADRLFASTEQGGKWSAPQQLDASLPGLSSAPSVAAADGGRFVVVFIDAGELYATVRPAAGMAFTAPQPLAAGATLPDVSISTDGTAYLAFTAPGPAGSDVYGARLDRTQTAFVMFAQPFNLNPAEPAGYNAALRPRVWTATDATALVTWGENNADGFTHVVARRVSSLGLSDAPQDLWVASLDGMAGMDADSPSVTLEDASDFGWIAFRETFMQGATPVSRVLAEEQLGSEFRVAMAIDSLTFPVTDTADDPDVQIDGSGAGLATVETAPSDQVIADRVNGNNLAKATVRLDDVTNTIAPQPQTAIGGVDDLGGVAWMQSTGATNLPSVQLRTYDGAGFAPQELTSVSALGAVDTTTGVSVGSDRYGDVLVAFLQGAPAQTTVEVGGDARPPEGFRLSVASLWSDSAQPLLHWQAAYDDIQPVTYRVYESGKLVGTTTATKLLTPAPVAQGSFPVRIVATNGFGLHVASPTETVTSVTTPPQVSLSIKGTRSPASMLTFTVNAASPAPVPAPIVSLHLQFGDSAGATTSTGQLTQMHAYAASGTYTVTVTALDQAGNTTVLTRRVHIK